MDRAALGGIDRALFVDRRADDVEDAAKRCVANRHRNGRVLVDDLRAAHQTFGRVHRDGAHGVLAQVLRDLKDQILAVILCDQDVEDLRHLILEMHVNDGADDLRDFADCVCHVVSSPVLRALQRPR